MLVGSQSWDGRFRAENSVLFLLYSLCTENCMGINLTWEVKLRHWEWYLGQQFSNCAFRIREWICHEWWLSKAITASSDYRLLFCWTKFPVFFCHCIWFYPLNIWFLHHIYCQLPILLVLPLTKIKCWINTSYRLGNPTYWTCMVLLPQESVIFDNVTLHSKWTGVIRHTRGSIGFDGIVWGKVTPWEDVELNLISTHQ